MAQWLRLVGVIAAVGGLDVRADQGENNGPPAPTWRATGVLLIDRPAQQLAFGLDGRAELGPGHFAWRIGNWDPRPRITYHATLPWSRAGWHFQTGIHEWQVPADELARYRHHVFVVDRPFYHQPGGTQQERVLHVSLSSDIVTPRDSVAVAWHWRGSKGLDAPKNARVAAYVQQAPTYADDRAGWQRLALNAVKETEATLLLPRSLKVGVAWLRIGLSEGPGQATDRLLAELPLMVKSEKPAPVPPPLPPRTVTIGQPLQKTNVPNPWQQGVFLQPQSVSTLDVSDDGRFIGLNTLAFRHDRNSWLLSEAGRVLWGRYVEPWAPFQTAVLPEAKAVAVGLAYSRFTDPSPTVSLFQGETSAETALVDNIWDMGWLRYGLGDWRTGWPASLVGDLIVRTHSAVFTVFSNDGAWRFTGDGGRHRYPLLYQRPFRMAASRDGHLLAFGYLAPDATSLDEANRQRLRLRPGLLAVNNALTSGTLWTVAPMKEAPAVARPPEPADEFPDLADTLNMKPLTMLPFRVAASVAVNGDGSKVAVTEYGGWLRVKRARGIGSWNPDHPVPFCPRQKGWLRIFGALGEQLVQVEMPREGLFEVQMDRQGDTLWCTPISWFSRGLAGRPWLPADPQADTVFVYDLRRRAWTGTWRFPDAISDLAVRAAGDRALVSCWDGILFLVGSDGVTQAHVNVGSPARLRWSADDRFAVAGTSLGEVVSLDADGQVRWKTALPVQPIPALKEPVRPVIDGIPIYSVGRVGTEHAYVGDIWLIKTKEGGIIVDTGGTSGIPYTWQRMKAAGLDPKEVRYVLLSHSHGDHAGVSYLWRTQGAKVVAPATAGLTVTWLMPTWSDYSIWVPSPIDQPLPLKRAGDETDFKLCGVPIKAIFVPGHSFDSVLYLMELDGKRVLFTGDIGFEGGSHILHRCWGDVDSALRVSKVLRTQVLPLKPDHVFTGHGPRPRGVGFLENLLKRTDEALGKPSGK
jgi:glyoxylase-like metal-dependent hydrolase (beta-lactamase superfamily II)